MTDTLRNEQLGASRVTWEWLRLWLFGRWESHTSSQYMKARFSWFMVNFPDFSSSLMNWEFLSERWDGFHPDICFREDSQNSFRVLSQSILNDFLAFSEKGSSLWNGCHYSLFSGSGQLSEPYSVALSRPQLHILKSSNSAETFGPTGFCGMLPWDSNLGDSRAFPLQHQMFLPLPASVRFLTCFLFSFKRDRDRWWRNERRRVSWSSTSQV